MSNRSGHTFRDESSLKRDCHAFNRCIKRAEDSVIFRIGS